MLLGIAVAGLLELAQQLLLALGQVDRRLDHDLDEHVAACWAVQLAHALVLEPDLLAGLGPRRNRDPQAPALDRGHLDLAAQSRGGHRNRHPAEDVRPLATEQPVRRYGDEDIEVPGLPAADRGLALAGEPDAGPVLDTRRDIDRQSLL